MRRERIGDAVSGGILIVALIAYQGWTGLAIVVVALTIGFFLNLREMKSKKTTSDIEGS